jgi:hypothetical protein
MQPDLASRAELAIAGGLQLRKRTTAHLNAMTGNREYLVTRYGPEMTTTASQINRLTATLEEVAIKVTRMMNIPGEQAAAEDRSRHGTSVRSNSTTCRLVARDSAVQKQIESPPPPIDGVTCDFSSSCLNDLLLLVGAGSLVGNSVDLRLGARIVSQKTPEIRGT